MCLSSLPHALPAGQRSTKPRRPPAAGVSRYLTGKVTGHRAALPGGRKWTGWLPGDVRSSPARACPATWKGNSSARCHVGDLASTKQIHYFFNAVDFSKIKFRQAAWPHLAEQRFSVLKCTPYVALGFVYNLYMEGSLVGSELSRTAGAAWGLPGWAVPSGRGRAPRGVAGCSARPRLPAKAHPESER